MMSIVEQQNVVKGKIRTIQDSINVLELEENEGIDKEIRLSILKQYESLLFNVLEDSEVRHLVKEDEEVVLCVRNHTGGEDTEEDKILLGRDYKLPLKNRIDRLQYDSKSIHRSFPNIVPIPRLFVEGNPHYRQLCVGILLTQGDKLILLQNTEKHRLANKISLIQGHVDIPHNLLNVFEQMSCNLMTYLERTVYKELTEEIGGLENVQLKPKLIDIICSDDNEISKEHLGFIFNIELPDYIDISKLTSKEPEKHSMLITNEAFIKSILSNTRLDNDTMEIDEWLRCTILGRMIAKHLEADKLTVEKVQLTKEEEEKINNNYIKSLNGMEPIEKRPPHDSDENILIFSDEEMEFCRALKVLVNNPYTKDFIYCAENAVKDETTGKWILSSEKDEIKSTSEVSDGLERYEMLDSLTGRNVLSGVKKTTYGDPLPPLPKGPKSITMEECFFGAKEVGKVKNNMTPPPIPEGPQFRVIGEAFSNLFKK